MPRPATRCLAANSKRDETVQKSSCVTGASRRSPEPRVNTSDRHAGMNDAASSVVPDLDADGVLYGFVYMRNPQAARRL